MKVLTPKEITENIIRSNTQKAKGSLLTTILLGILAGGYIGLGAVFYTIVKADSTYSFATKQILGGFVFSLGLILVLIAGAQLFTGNNLMTTAFAHKKVSLKEILKNWGIIFFSNMIGAVGLAFLIYQSGHLDMNNGAIAKTYIKMTEAKISLPIETAFFKGVLCNILVCLAVWLAAGGKSLSDKVLAIVFPITLFVAAGFEHSIANLFIIPLGLMIDAFGYSGISPHHFTFIQMWHNIIPVALGNIVGGGFFVGLVYYFTYYRNEK